MTARDYSSTAPAQAHDSISSGNNVFSHERLRQSVAALCRDGTPAAASLHKALQAFSETLTRWPALVKRFKRPDFSIYHHHGTLADLLDLPGDVALVRLMDDSVVLLRRFDQRWRILGTDGEPLADLAENAGAGIAEGVVLPWPTASAKPVKIGMLALLWQTLLTAWLEVSIGSLLLSAGQIVLPLFSMLVYDKVVNNGVFSTLWGLVIGIGIYLFMDVGLRVLRVLSLEQTAADLSRRSDEGLWRRLLAQTDMHGGFARFLSQYRDLAASRDFVSSTYFLALIDLPFMLLGLLAVSLISWELLLVGMTLLGIYGLTGLLLQIKANAAAKSVEITNTRKLTYMGEVLGSLDVLRTVPSANLFLRRWRELSDQSAQMDAGRRLIAGYQTTFSLTMTTISTVTMLTAGAYLIEARALSVGGLIACNLLVSRVMGLAASLFLVAGKWKEFERASQRLDTSLSVPVEHQTTPLPRAVGKLAVIKLHKQYAGRAPALDGVNLNFTPGERVALLGRPGAGKTTLLRCLARLCDPDQGQILIDGIDIRHIGANDRNAWLAWKSQDPALFAGTIEENLRVSGSAPGQARFEQALWASGLKEEIDSGRLSLGMMLEERGSNLSGGQRQKVALARALAQPARILLLDEPTLGLDPESERLLAQRLPVCLGDQATLIMTTHSAIMLEVVQRVVALDGGKVIADGPRSALVHTDSSKPTASGAMPTASMPRSSSIQSIGTTATSGNLQAHR